jgi:hypothetical protein
MDVEKTTAVVWAVEFPGDGGGEGVFLIPFNLPVNVVTAHLKIVALFYEFTGSRDLPTGMRVAPMDDILDELGDDLP